MTAAPTDPHGAGSVAPPSATGQSDGPARTEHSPWLVLFTLCLGFFMILLDTTIVNIAIPDMSVRLNATLDQILWVLNAYVLVYAVLLITAGRLGDLYGPKQLFLIGLTIFTLASVACGFAHDPAQLIVARIAQGVGGALLTPQTLSVITMIFPAEKRGAAFGVWGAVAGVATVAGPTLGGLIVTDWGWRWIFFVNLPIGILTLVLAALFMPNLRLNRQHRLDIAGTLLATVGLFLVTYGLIEGQPHGWGKVWGPVTIPMVIIGGGIVLAFFGIQQYARRDDEPLIPFAIFRDRNFSLMNFVGAAVGFSMLGLFLPLVIFLQSALGLSALQAGLTVAPMSLVSMFFAPVAGRMADRIGGKYILLAGLTLFALGMGIVITSAHVDSTRLSLLPGLIVAGIGLGLTFAPLQTVAMRNIEPRMAGAASGLINTSRQLGAVIGSAAVGALLQHELARLLPRAAEQNASALPEPARQPFIDGFRSASSGSLEIGSGQTGVKPPPGLPQQVAEELGRVATLTFHQGFTNAMRVTLILPIAVLALAALSCLLIRRRAVATAATAPSPPRTASGEDAYSTAR
jgi:EmrB/QacA subfamily drug resistance transporter